MKKLFNFILVFFLAISCCFTIFGCTNDNSNKPPVNTTSYEIKVKANTQEGGVVYGAGSYTDGEHITIAAVANPDYKFVKWNDNSTQNPRTIKVKNDYNYIAYFEKEELYALNSIAVYVTEVNSAYSTIEISKFAIKLNDKSIGGFNYNSSNSYNNQGFDIYSKENSYIANLEHPMYIFTDLNENNVCSQQATIKIDYRLETESSINPNYDFSRSQEFTVVPNLTKSTRTLEQVTLTILDTTYSFNLNIILDFVRIYK